ncbi:unnamed protein product [Nesidiocoris tenuis]|uniref:Fe2OG dioxygenase domain-containing protein n=1 Tax=Nesidiocoris tenuis TaxID=355587 RepID=A0A6H5GLS8_9HEMI|nr:unnamed protein product [Nesidiocoris tenuis]
MGLVWESSLKISYLADLITFTVATDETDGYLRYIRSAHLYGYHVKTLGMNEKWKGGDMYHRGGGHKVNLFRSALKPLKGNRDIVILFTDSYDVVFLGLPDQVLEKFKAFDSRIVFSAEITLWPDRSLFSEFPATENPYKYLNSGAFIGYAGDLYEILDSRPIKNDDDDQLYYTQIFLNKTLREKYRMRLDTKGSIFQNMYGATQDLKLNMDNAKEEGTTLENVLTGEQPLVLHGNGLSKLAINSFANYLARSWDPINGCTACPKEPLDVTPPPIVMLSIFIPWNTPFLEEFFERIQNLTYPKNRMILFVYNNKIEFFLCINRFEYHSYKPDEQPSLRPHHDSSTYTINLALNKPGVDYTGGGCRFIRYNCSVTNTRVGWLLMHPGRLTHYHEGLKVTSGTRYIVISFVDP